MREAEWWAWKDAMAQALRAGGYIPDSGPVDDAVNAALENDTIRTLADQLPDHEPHLIRELLETGAWTIGELGDHETNLERMMWIIACEAREDDL